MIVSVAIRAQSLEESWQIEKKYRKTGMAVLGTWSVANIGVGLVARSQTDGTEQYFHEMNAIWNTVNLGIAAAGYFSVLKMSQPNTALELYQYQNKLDKTLLLNTGIDLAYIATGIYLTERGLRENENFERFKGYGNSLIFQGAFLFVFDLSMVFLHKQILVADDMILSFRAVPGQFRATLNF